MLLRFVVIFNQNNEIPPSGSSMATIKKIPRKERTKTTNLIYLIDYEPEDIAPKMKKLRQQYLR